jgi:uncharacterized phage protein (TIGR02220 family)
MAGDWIKMRIDLGTSPKVVRIASALRADRLRVVGGLHAVWCLFDVHSDDGKLHGYTTDALDELIGFPGFSAAMIAVGWLEDGGEFLAAPRFEEHNGQSAKRRAMETERKREARKVSASGADKKRTREEKRREEEEKTLSGKPDDAKPQEVDPDSPAGLLEYLNAKTGRSYRDLPANIDFLKARLAESSAAEIRAVIDTKAAQWGKDDKMADYLRPATLFNRTKFAQYLGEIGADGSVLRPADQPWAGAL